MIKDNDSVKEFHDSTKLSVINTYDAPDTTSVVSTVNSTDSLKENNDTMPTESESRTVVLGQGETLRILALNYFGNKEFWVYIYIENKDQISDPNSVQMGINLSIPSNEKYGIDANDQKSISNAIRLGKEELEKFK